MRDVNPTVRASGSARGFSLIELLIAMVVTLIVTGAIYGLLATGQTAFRREPEVAERQQNIRIAMDLITRDIGNAGSGMPVVSQVFTHSDGIGAPPPFGAPGLNGSGPQGVLGAAGVAQRGDASDNSDILEIVSADESCPFFTVCDGLGAPVGGGAGTAPVRESIPNPGCLLPVPNPAPARGLILFTDNRSFSIQPGVLAAGNGACGSGGPTRGIALTAALPRFGPQANLVAPVAGVAGLAFPARITRYVIAQNPDPADPNPALWRSATGLFDAQGAFVGGIPAAPPVPNNWQMVARGIEDLQVEYLNGNGVWANQPGVVRCADPAACAVPEFGTVVRQVRVTLSARTLAPLLSGAMNPAGGPAPQAVRGQLVSIVTPRATIMGLQSVGQFP